MIMHSHTNQISSKTTLHKPFRNMMFQNIFSVLLLLSLFITVHSCGPGRGIGGPRKNRKLTPLVFKQHVPNMSENMLGASGLREGRIERTHPKFKDLVPNYNKDIIFKDDEGTGADRVMSTRCKDRLNTLAVSVMNQWPGVRLRVTESWDEDNVHGNESLHYEGRAVDITTSDRDRSKYGMLARLAVEAGFDWVYYESRAHIHCSVRSDSHHTSHLSGCFTANSTVLTSTGIHRRLNELRLGEKVLSMTATGNAVFSEVIMFLDRNDAQVRDFVRITTDGGAVLSVTPAHLIMVWNPDKELSKFIFAAEIEEGDYVLVNMNSTLVPRKVRHIATIRSRGVYAPLTREGTIVVDSVVASCYALVNSQSLAHWGFVPFRIVNYIKDWFSDNSLEESRQSGVHWYANALYKMKDYVLPSDWIYH